MDNKSCRPGRSWQGRPSSTFNFEIWSTCGVQRVQPCLGSRHTRRREITTTAKLHSQRAHHPSLLPFRIVPRLCRRCSASLWEALLLYHEDVHPATANNNIHAAVVMLQLILLPDLRPYGPFTRGDRMLSVRVESRNDLLLLARDLPERIHNCDIHPQHSLHIDGNGGDLLSKVRCLHHSLEEAEGFEIGTLSRLTFVLPLVPIL